MKASQKRAKVETAIAQSGKRVKEYFEEAYRAANNGQLDQERVNRHIGDYHNGNGHPPGYVMDHTKQPVAQANTRQRMPRPHSVRSQHHRPAAYAART